jgi:3-oxoacyl-[acyl-carrier protein] reductase
MVAPVLDDFGFVDLLVANAGVASRGLPVANTDPGEVDRLLATHAVSAAAGYVTGQRIQVDGGGSAIR